MGLPQPRQKSVGSQIATALGETDELVRKKVKRIVKTIGESQAQELLRTTMEIEANGGEVLPDGSRRRTAGGIFFRLARETVTPEQRALRLARVRRLFEKAAVFDKADKLVEKYRGRAEATADSTVQWIRKPIR